MVKQKDTYRTEVFEDKERRLNDEGNTVTMRAEVLDMDCGVNMVGHSEHKTLKHFLVTLKCDDGVKTNSIFQKQHFFVRQNAKNEVIQITVFSV